MLLSCLGGDEHDSSLYYRAAFNPYQYTGRENDATGLYFHRARYYNPSFQRFISEDPIGMGGGINLYAYVGNNPISFATAAASSLKKNAQNAKPPHLSCATHEP